MKTEIEVKTEKIRNAARPSLTRDGAANILIVDDDVDSALLVESMFARLGCKTNCSLTSSDARKMICTQKADIIILDWRLDQQTDANTVVAQCTDRLAKFATPADNRRRPKIVTYSSLELGQIDILDNGFFEHLDHWQKPMSQRDLLVRALGLLKQVGR